MIRFFGLLAILLPVFADGQDTKSIRAETYFTDKVCSEVLAGVSLEISSLENLESQNQAYQLLFDYKLIMSNLHEQAIRNMTLKLCGLTDETLAQAMKLISAGGSKGRAKLREIEAALKEMVDFSKGKGKVKSRAILNEMRALAESSEFNSSKADQVVSARIKNLQEAMSSLEDDHPLWVAYQNFNQATLALSYTEILAKKAALLDDKSGRLKKWLVIGSVSDGNLPISFFTLFGAGVGELFYNMAATDHVGLLGTAVGLGVWLSPVLVVAPQYGLAKIKKLFLKPKLRDRKNGFSIEGLRTSNPSLTARNPDLEVSAAIRSDGLVNNFYPISPPVRSGLEEAASQKNITDFTPVDIAYLGQVELAELEKDRETLLKDLGRHQPDLQAARAAAVELGKDASHYNLQVDFMGKFKRLLGTREVGAIQTHWEKYSSDLKKVNEEALKIRALPYLIPEDQRAIGVKLGQYLIKRLTDDFSDLNVQMVNAESMKKEIDQLAHDRERLAAILQKLGLPDSDWATGAASGLRYLDSF